MLALSEDDPVATALASAIHSGDVGKVGRLLGEHPELASARVQGRKAGGGFRTPLHMVADWPGYFPCGPRIVGMLIDAGADPSAPCEAESPAETPLHWAASSDDVDVAAALIDGGADIEAPGASIAGGPPLDCAVGYGCWHVARLLVDRGARVDRLWHAAALGMIARAKELLAADPPPTREDIEGPSTKRATAVSAGWPNSSSVAAQTSTRCPSTASKRHLTPRGRSTLGGAR